MRFGARPPRRDVVPHLDIDLAGFVGYCPGEGGVRVAANSTTGSGAPVFPAEGVIDIPVVSRTKMTVGHERGALGEWELGGTRSGAGVGAVRVGAPARVDAGGVPPVVGVARVEVVTELVHELERGRRTRAETHADRLR